MVKAMFSGVSCAYAPLVSSAATSAMLPTSPVPFMAVPPLLSEPVSCASFQRRNPNGGGELLVDVGGELQSETRARRHRDVAVLDRRQRGDQVAVPGPMIGAHALLNEGIGRVERQVGGGAEHDRAGAVV